MNRKSIIIIGMIAIMSLITSCQSNKKIQNGKITVYTSFYAMYDLTKKIGGDRINLVNLIPAGTEPHEWEPSPGDIVNLENADVLIYNGAGMEGWVPKVLKALKNNKLKVLESAKGLKLLENKNKNEELKYDPHVWLNPLQAEEQMRAISETLISADPANKEYYSKNYQVYSAKMDDLDREFKEALSGLKKRDVVVAHQAFGYLCEAYGLNQVAIEGLNADSEPTPSRMAEIAQFAKRNSVKVIFFEDLISPKVANTLAKTVGAKVEVLNPLEGLREKDILAGKDYISVMRENLAALKKALE